MWLRRRNGVGLCWLMVARVLRRLHDTTGELSVLVMREGVRDTTEQRMSERQRD